MGPQRVDKTYFIIGKERLACETDCLLDWLNTSLKCPLMYAGSICSVQ